MPDITVPGGEVDALPLPGPSRQHGAAGMMLRYNISSLLMLLNPFQLSQVVAQLRGEVAARARLADRPLASPAIGLPFEGEWLAFNGGITEETSHSWEILSQRYAYDFVIADSAGIRHRHRGSRGDDYFCHGQPIRAVADGTVVLVRDGVRDAPWVGTGWVDWLARDFGGNSVTIRHGDALFSYSAHLLPGSLTHRPGDSVEKGDVIGRCGNSGHSTEPHLHFQLQDGPDFLSAVGIPISFERCIVDGTLREGPVTVTRGMRVQQVR